MVIRKYADGATNLEVSVSEDHTLILFELEKDGVYLSIGMDYKDSSDLKDQLYNLIREIEPTKKSNG